MSDRRHILEQAMIDHGDYLKRTAYLYLKDLNDAEDAVQETFISYYRSVSSFRGDSSTKTYLYRILMNHCHRLHKKKRTILPFDDERGLIGKETDILTKLTLEDAVDHLKEKYKQVIILHYYVGMSVKEVADSIGVSESNTKVRLSRARDMLRELLGEEVETNEV